MAQIAFTRIDLAQVGQTKRSCLKIIPTERTSDGKVKTLERVAYKTPPSKPIQAVCLAGSLNSINDKIFIATDNTVRGISKKGKFFFSFETNLAEPIKRMFIRGVEMACCGTRTYTHYHDCVQVNHIVLDEDILDIVSLPSEGGWVGRAYTSLLACEGSTIKVIESSQIDYDIKLEDTAITLALFMGDGGHNKMHVLYGTKTGHLGLLNAQQKAGNIEWEINTSSTAGVTCITCYALTSSTKDVIIGKEDGRVEIYTVDTDDVCSLRQMIQCDESITSLACGRVSNEHLDDIVICTYTGWVFSLSRTPEGNVSSEAPPVHAVNAKVQQLKNEVAELEQKVHEERMRYSEMINKDTDGTTASFVPSFQVHDSWELNKKNGSYVLTLQLVLPIEMVVLMSEIDFKLEDVERNTAVLGYTTPTSGPFTSMVTYRCQSSQTRIEMCLRVKEGKSGLIVVLVIPTIHPPVGQFCQFELKPLCLHVRSHYFDSSRPLNVLRIKGQFSLGEAHAWISMCLEGVSSKIANAASVTYNFECLVDGGSQLEVTASRGMLQFRSDSLITICTLRDVVNRETTSRNMRVEMDCVVSPSSLEHCLTLLHPKMSRILEVDRKSRLAKALKELESSEADLSFLADEYLSILKEHDSLILDATNNPIDDSPLLSVYQQLFLSKWKLEGFVNASQHLPALMHLLNNKYSLESVLQFFSSPLSYNPDVDDVQQA